MNFEQICCSPPERSVPRLDSRSLRRGAGKTTFFKMLLADRLYVLNNGHMVESLSALEVRERPDVLHRHLGV
jgi:hypothetical protein